MQFGGCYLGKHTGEINLIQQRYVEAEIIVHEINRHLGESDEPVEFPEERLEEAVAELLKNFHNDDAFRKMDDGKYEVALDGEAVREAARSLLAG
jgi:chaperone required for assembly of F1-ATPase